MDEDRSPLRKRIDGLLSGYPDALVQRELYRLPVVLWRLGLGPLVGRPLCLLTVTGRSSGLPRRTPLHPHVVGGKTYVWCPYGLRAQWYRNMIANPVVTVQSRQGTQVMRAVAIEDDDEAIEVISDLRRFDMPMLQEYLETEGIADTPEDIAKNRQRLHIRRLVATSEEGPPALAADLAWVWVVPVVVGALRGKRRRRRVRAAA